MFYSTSGWSIGGETSLTTIEAMRYGAVPFVKNEGWYGELPKDLVVHVANEDELKVKLLQLQSNPGKLRSMRQETHSYIANNYSHEQYAANLVKFIDAAQSAAGFNFRRASLLKSTNSLDELKKALQ